MAAIMSLQCRRRAFRLAFLQRLGGQRPVNIGLILFSVGANTLLSKAR